MFEALTKYNEGCVGYPRELHRYFISTIKYDDVLIWLYAQRIGKRKLSPTTKKGSQTSTIISELVKCCNPELSLEILTPTFKDLQIAVSKINYGGLWSIFKMPARLKCELCKSTNSQKSYGFGGSKGYGEVDFKVLCYCEKCTNDMISIASKCIFDLGNEEFKSKYSILSLIKKVFDTYKIDTDCSDIIFREYIRLTFYKPNLKNNGFSKKTIQR